MMRAAPSCTEHELVAAVRRGSDQAFEELYARYRGRIGAYVIKMLADHARAEDVVQDVFIAALRRLRNTERPIAFKPWIYEIAKNACIDEFRRTNRGKEVPLEDDDTPSDASGELLPGGPPLEATIESKQRLDDLRGAFQGLSENHHRIIVMRELAGLSYEEIGQRMGISKPVVESTLFRARRRLSTEYEEIVTGRRCERVRTMIAADTERPLRTLGLRDRRQLARHLAHCQPCRRCARMAEVDESFFQAPTLIGKIATLLPLPWLRARRSHADDPGAGGVGPRSIGAPSLQSVAPWVDPAGPLSGLGRLAATAAAVVVTAAGGGLIAGLSSSGAGLHPRAGAGGGRTGPAPNTSRTTGNGVTAANAGTAGGGVVLPGAGGRAVKRSSNDRAGGGSSGGGSTGTSAGSPGAGHGTGGGTAGAAGRGPGGAARASTAPTSRSSGGGGGTGTNSGPLGSLVSGVTNTAGSGLRQTTAGAGSTVSGLTSTVGKVVNGLSPQPQSLPVPKLPSASLPKLPPLPAVKASVSVPSLPMVSQPSAGGLVNGLTHK